VSLNTIRYYFSEAFHSILRNSWLSAASIGVVAVSLLILGGSLLLVVNAGEMASDLESNIEISVFLKDDAAQTDISKMERDLRAMPGVHTVEFVSRDRALQEMKDRFSDNEDLLAGLEESNPLPDAFRIRAINPEQVASLAQLFTEMPLTERVRFGQGVVEKLMAVSQWVRVAGMVLMVLLGAASVFLIATTIRLSVFARRREIGIMKFLGATNMFVRMPFLLEGMFLGLVGSLMAVLVIFFGYSTLLSNIGESMPFIKLVSDPKQILYMLEGLLGLGLLIGIIGSMVSMRKFLKV
jgi:cell division transport system permease protein